MDSRGLTFGGGERQASEGRIVALSPEVRAGLLQLARAYECAHEVQCNPWDFAVEIDRLFGLGLSTTDLRWLAKRGYVEQAREITSPADSIRRFEPDQNLAFTQRTCFIITDTGMALTHPEATSPPVIPLAERVTPKQESAVGLPHWDREVRILRLGDQIVKQYRVPSPNQEAVLEAFEEELWPTAVDDPLPPVLDQDPKCRLRDTIKCLNMNQVNRLIRFRGDGTGQRVRWELVAEVAPRFGFLGETEPPLRKTA